ncbi:MAG TPA: hypothetical protein PKN80_00115 [bacterium]|nr:hypothetical protein [bacterium]
MSILDNLREKHRVKLSESSRRKEISFSFREPDRVPIRISAAGSYYAHMFGYNIKDYYQEADVQVDTQLRGIEWRLENLKDDNTDTEIHLDIGPISEGLVFDCPIERPDGTSPRIVPILKDEHDFAELRVPDPKRLKGLEWLDRRFEDFYRAAARRESTCPEAVPG